MPSKLLLVSALTFGTGVMLVLSLLLSSGGSDKAKQFAVLGELASGRHGLVKRNLLLAGVLAIAMGSCSSFISVAVGDAQLRELCQQNCSVQGYAEGTIGLSATSARTPHKVCRCAGAGMQVLELELDGLAAAETAIP